MSFATFPWKDIRALSPLPWRRSAPASRTPSGPITTSFSRKAAISMPRSSSPWRPRSAWIRSVSVCACSPNTRAARWRRSARRGATRLAGDAGRFPQWPPDRWGADARQTGEENQGSAGRAAPLSVRGQNLTLARGKAGDVEVESACPDQNRGRKPRRGFPRIWCGNVVGGGRSICLASRAGSPPPLFRTPKMGTRGAASLPRWVFSALALRVMPSRTAVEGAFGSSLRLRNRPAWREQRGPLLSSSSCRRSRPAPAATALPNLIASANSALASAYLPARTRWLAMALWVAPPAGSSSRALAYRVSDSETRPA